MIADVRPCAPLLLCVSIRGKPMSSIRYVLHKSVENNEFWIKERANKVITISSLSLSTEISNLSSKTYHNIEKWDNIPMRLLSQR